MSSLVAHIQPMAYNASQVLQDSCSDCGAATDLPVMDVV
jgi:hypothetical protein